MVTALILAAFIPFVFGYWLGRTRCRDRLPFEIYDAKGRRVN